MRRSTERFLTTHTGSLPRPDDLIRAMFAREEGVPVDASALGARILTAVAEAVKKQVAAGIDIVDDGEFSKPSYATYVKDRLTGITEHAPGHPGEVHQILVLERLARAVEPAQAVLD